MECQAIMVLDKGVVQGIAHKAEGETERLLAYGVLQEETEALGEAMMVGLFEELVKKPIPDRKLKLTLTAEYLN